MQFGAVHSSSSLSVCLFVCLSVSHGTHLLPVTTEHTMHRHATPIVGFCEWNPVTSRVSVTVDDTEDLTVGGAVTVLATDRH
jgi:hypothetical protein